jgi:hypothetical protein
MTFDKSLIPFIFFGIACLYVYSCMNTCSPPMRHVQSKLKMQAYEIKQNDIRDEVVIVTHVAVTYRGSDGHPYFWVDYVDECGLLDQINYSPSIEETDDLGQQFLLLQDAPPPRIIDDTVNRVRSGGLTIFVILEPRDDIPADATPYFERRGDKRHLVLPESVYNDTQKRGGQFTFLDKNGNVLDRFILKRE